MAAPLTAPRTSFNGTITGHRTIAIEDISLDKIKEIKNAVEGATVNDVVITVCGGALRRYLEERGELPDELAGRLGAGLGARRVEEARRQQQGLHDLLPPRHRRRGPARAPRARSPRATPTPRTTTRRSRPTPCRTGPSSPPRAPSASRCAMVSSLKLADSGPVIHNLVISNVPVGVTSALVLSAPAAAAVPLIFGAEFRSGGASAAVLTLGVCVALMAAPLHPLYLHRGSDKSYGLALTVAAALNLILNVLFIPAFGLPGAASATLASQIAIYVALLLMTRRLTTGP